MELDEKKIPTIFKAFCDENRVKILKLLLTGEKCACVLSLYQNHKVFSCGGKALVA